MRYAKSKIKEGIFHAEEGVRLTVLGYFEESFTDDESVMPLVIEVVENYGRASAFRVIRDAERLPKTEATFDWLVSELRRDKHRPKYSDEPSWRISHKLQFSSERVRSMLRGIDTVLTG